VITFQLSTFGKMISITRQDIINDDLGFLSVIPRELAKAAMRKISDLVHAPLIANTGSFFHSVNHGNHLTGGGSALSTASLGAAITAMRKQRDANNADLDIVPTTLVVPPDLEQTARALLESMEIQAAEGLPMGNSLKGATALQIESRLSNDDRFAAASTTAWYLFGPPSASPVVIGFLNGKQEPTVESQDAVFHTLGIQLRVYHDAGVGLGDYRAAVKSDGA